MKKFALAIATAFALTGCAALTVLDGGLTLNQVYIAANAFDAAEITATNYLGLPTCSTGGPTICKSPSAVASIIPAVRNGHKTRTALVAACAANIAAANCVSGYQALTATVNGLQATFAAYNIAK